jgi:hypothetical protein
MIESRSEEEQLIAADGTVSVLLVTYPEIAMRLIQRYPAKPSRALGALARSAFSTIGRACQQPSEAMRSAVVTRQCYQSEPKPFHRRRSGPFLHLQSFFHLGETFEGCLHPDQAAHLICEIPLQRFDCGFIHVLFS